VVGEALRAVAASGCVVEINTGAITRNYGKHFYPSERIVAAMAGMRIPVTLGSDAHSPAHVAAHFGAALDVLRRAGYRECWRRTGRSWTAVPLDTVR
jgi:histidinol-phosphatase (PHP family)